MAHTTCNYFDTLQNCRFIVGRACFALYFDEKCFKTASKNYGRRKRWQREHQKRNRFILAKKTLHMYNAFFCSFLSRRCTTTTWKCLISRFVEGGNTTFFFFSWTLIQIFTIKLQKKFAIIWRIIRDGISPINFEAVWIHFLSDVSWPSSSLLL